MVAFGLNSTLVTCTFRQFSVAVPFLLFNRWLYIYLFVYRTSFFHFEFYSLLLHSSLLRCMVEHTLSLSTCLFSLLLIPVFDILSRTIVTSLQKVLCWLVCACGSVLSWVSSKSQRQIFFFCITWFKSNIEVGKFTFSRSESQLLKSNQEWSKHLMIRNGVLSTSKYFYFFIMGKSWYTLLLLICKAVFFLRLEFSSKSSPTIFFAWTFGKILLSISEHANRCRIT